MHIPHSTAICGLVLATAEDVHATNEHSKGTQECASEQLSPYLAADRTQDFG